MFVINFFILAMMLNVDELPNLPSPPPVVNYVVCLTVPIDVVDIYLDFSLQINIL